MCDCKAKIKMMCKHERSRQKSASRRQEMRRHLLLHCVLHASIPLHPLRRRHKQLGHGNIFGISWPSTAQWRVGTSGQPISEQQRAHSRHQTRFVCKVQATDSGSCTSQQSQCLLDGRAHLHSLPSTPRSLQDAAMLMDRPRATSRSTWLLRKGSSVESSSSPLK